MNRRDFARGNDFDALAQIGLRSAVERALDRGGIAYEERAESGIVTKGLRSAGDIVARRAVATHDVDGYRLQVSRDQECGAYSASSTSAGFSMTRLPR